MCHPTKDKRQLRSSSSTSPRTSHQNGFTRALPSSQQEQQAPGEHYHDQYHRATSIFLPSDTSGLTSCVLDREAFMDSSPLTLSSMVDDQQANSPQKHTSRAEQSKRVMDILDCALAILDDDDMFSFDEQECCCPSLGGRPTSQ